MFIGHLAVGFAAKRGAPRTSLGTLMIAPLFLDLLWPIFLALGVEKVRIDPGNTAFTPLDFVRYPVTHSLFMALIWAALFAGLYLVWTGYRAGARWIAIGVVSHWVLDWVTHRADLQIVPWSAARVGLGLWNSRAGTLVVETLMLAIGLWLYLGVTRARRWGRLSLWSFVVVMYALYIANAFGPPPPSAQALGTAAFITWLFVPWVFWIDRTRPLRGL